MTGVLLPEGTNREGWGTVPRGRRSRGVPRMIVSGHSIISGASNPGQTCTLRLAGPSRLGAGTALPPSVWFSFPRALETVRIAAGRTVLTRSGNVRKQEISRVGL